MLKIPLTTTVEAQVYSAQEVDARLADLAAQIAALPEGSAGKSIAFANLFGPVQGAAGLTQSAPAAWTFPGSAMTASTKEFLFEYGLRPALKAKWTVVWTPNSANNRLRLVDLWGADVHEIAQVQGQAGGTPVPVAMDITSAYNALVAAGVNRHIGFQVWGDGTTPFTLYESRLTMALS